MKSIRQLIARGYTKAVLVPASLLVAAGASNAQSTDGISAALDAVDLSGVGTKVGAAALVVVAIALVFKGPDLAKRVVRKV